jgi:hypothetical protein
VHTGPADGCGGDEETTAGVVDGLDAERFGDDTTDEQRRQSAELPEQVEAGKDPFAVLWAVAQVLEWPVWARATLAGLAATAALVVPELRARFKQDDTRTASVTKAVAVPAGQGGCRWCGRRGWPSCGFMPQVQVPYVERHIQQRVAEALE